MDTSAVLCIYCQERAADSEDHVPPKLWVPPALRGDILRVPCCWQPCNQGFQEDDEYIRGKFMLRPEVASHPATRPVLDSFVRGMSRLQAGGLKHRLVNEVRTVEAVTEGGLLVGRETVPTVEAQRVERVIQRLVRALYYHETGAPLPATGMVAVDVTFERNQAQQATVRRYFAKQQPKGLCGNTLTYVWRQAHDGPHGSFWVLWLYGVVPFFAVTVGPEDAATVRERAAAWRRLLPY